MIVSLLAVLTVVPVGAKGSERGVLVLIDEGTAYYFKGELVGDGSDVPGHYWAKAGPNQWVGKNYDTGPGGLAQGWSSDAPDGELLYVVHGIIDTWTMEKAEA